MISKKPKRSKYRNIRTEIDGIKFHSKGEAARYIMLRNMQAQNQIHNLRLQVPYQITVCGLKICRYIADFVYTLPTGDEIVEDYKGKRTDVYSLKKKLLFATQSIHIKETTIKDLE